MLSSRGQYIVVLLLLPIFQSEIARAKKGWVEPTFTETGYKSTVRTLREDYTPGDLGFDPFGYKPTEPAALLEMQNKELNNGRNVYRDRCRDHTAAAAQRLRLYALTRRCR